MIIFCCGMRRSASTLQYHIVRELLPDYDDWGWTPWQEFDTKYNGNDAILKCHPFIPEYSLVASNLFESGQAKAIYIYRDIRDVVASLLRTERIMGMNYALENDIRAIIENFYKWTSINNVYIARYESVVNNISQMIREIADFLEVVTIDADYLADKYSLENQRKRQPLDKWDEYTTMHPGHIGTGAIGQYLPQDKLDVVMSIASDWLKEQGYESL